MARAAAYVLSMARPHAASLIEDAFHRRSNALMRGRGWGTRTISHTGYGSQDFVRVLGRVLLSRLAEPAEVSEADGIIRDFRGTADEQRGWRAFVTAGAMNVPCLLYTSDAADDLTRVDLGGRRIIKKKINALRLLWKTPIFPSKSKFLRLCTKC